MLPEEILKEAASLVAGQRAKQHGDYTALHSRIAELWSDPEIGGGGSEDQPNDARRLRGLQISALKKEEEKKRKKRKKK